MQRCAGCIEPAAAGVPTRVGPRDTADAMTIYGSRCRLIKRESNPMVDSDGLHTGHVLADVLADSMQAQTYLFDMM